MVLRTAWQGILEPFRKNLLTLVAFEIFYRVVGIMVVFPLARSLFVLSLRLQDKTYITNRMLIDYLQSPATLGLLGVLTMILTLYVALEFVFLAILIERGRQNERIGFFELLRTGGKRSVGVFKRHHVKFVLPAALLFFLLEAIHISPMAGTLTLPAYVVEQLTDIFILRLSLALLLVLLFFLFIQTALFLPAYIHDGLAPLKEKRLMKGWQRRKLRMAAEFLTLNVLLNVALYALFALIVLFVAFFAHLLLGAAFILGLVLASIHAIYVVLGLLASMVLIPLNYSLVASWHWRFLPEEALTRRKDEQISQRRPFSPRWKVVLFLLVGLFLVGNYFTVRDVMSEERSAIDYFNHPYIVAHRGASMDAPENTMASIEEAIRQRADFVEYDVRLTKDKEAVLMHDATLSRTTDAPSGTRVTDLTLAEIRMLDAGSHFSAEFASEKVPTLEEAVKLAQGRIDQFIELKVSDPHLEAEVLRLFAEYDLYGEVRVLSFDADQLRRIKQADEDIETVYLVGLFFGSITPIVEDEAIDHVAFEMNTLRENPHWVERLKRNGKEVHVWTVNDRDLMREAVRLEVDGIITDLPLVAREIAYEKNTPTFFAEVLRLLFSP